MQKQKFDGMTNSQLADVYNAMVSTAQREGIGDWREVSRFSTASAGVHRCERIQTALDAVLNAHRHKEDEQTKKVKMKKASTAKKRVSVGSDQHKFASETCRLFKVRSGSRREALLLALDKGHPVSVTNLIHAVYGNKDASQRGPLRMVMRGLFDSIKKDKLEYKIVKSDKNKEVYFELQTSS